MRLWILGATLAVALFAFGCKPAEEPKPVPPAAPEGTPPLTAPPVQAPYTLSDEDEKTIDIASDRRRIFVESLESSKKLLGEYQVKLANCDESVKAKSDQCIERQATMYCMLVADRYRELDDDESATAFYMEALERTVTLNQRLQGEYERDVKAAEDPKLSPEAKAIVEAFFSGRYHFQAYKDFGEIARYHKRLVEVAVTHNRKDTADAHWEQIEKAIKTSAEHLRGFRASVEKAKGVQGKFPKDYESYYQEVMRLNTALKIEQM